MLVHDRYYSKDKIAVSARYDGGSTIINIYHSTPTICGSGYYSEKIFTWYSKKEIFQILRNNGVIVTSDFIKYGCEYDYN